MKYDAQLTELKNLLPTAKNVLITLPVGADIDKLAAGLALFLILQQQGKEVTVISDDTITVGQAHLFGVDHIQKNLPTASGGGNLTLTLEGVASSDGTIPALEKLDWYSENNNLNLVFHVLPGQAFQPTKIVPNYQGSGFNLIFVIGSANLDSLGSVYKQNSQAFLGVHIVNIDNQNNTSFGQTNVVDTQSSSVSEVMTNVITDLGLTLDADCASNLLTGIFDATNNLTDPKVNADTYMVVADCLRVGGRKPGVSGLQVSPIPPQPSLSALIPPEPTYATASVGDQQVSEFTTPPVVHPVDAGGDHISNLPMAEQPASPAGRPSPEERPQGEGVISETPEPDWLTPKIFKGTSIG